MLDILIMIDYYLLEKSIFRWTASVTTIGRLSEANREPVQQSIGEFYVGNGTTRTDIR